VARAVFLSMRAILLSAIHLVADRDAPCRRPARSVSVLIQPLPDCSIPCRCILFERLEHVSAATNQSTSYRTAFRRHQRILIREGGGFEGGFWYKKHLDR